MAKEQGLSLNPTKISGSCGRLMCCLKHEQEVYEEKLSRLPNVGALVIKGSGIGNVTDSYVLEQDGQLLDLGTTILEVDEISGNVLNSSGVIYVNGNASVGDDITIGLSENARTE